MLKSVKRKIRLHKIKKEAMLPRQPSATMEDVQRKLAHYKATDAQALQSEHSIVVHYSA